jgi:hypothetical protein
MRVTGLQLNRHLDVTAPEILSSRIKDKLAERQNATIMRLRAMEDEVPRLNAEVGNLTSALSDAARSSASNMALAEAKHAQVRYSD